MEDAAKGLGDAREALPHGEALLHDPLLNKGTAFTARRARRARARAGCCPPHVHTLEEQVARVMDNYRNKQTDLERYIHLVSLQDRNETLFYRVVVDHIEEMMPIIYTPTVGQACQQWGHLFRRPRGLYVSWEDRGRVEAVLRNWPQPDVRVIVVTDGERILGLGDQGVGGMGIPVGQALALHRLRRHRPGPDACRSCSTWAPRTRATCATRSTWGCARSASAAEPYDAFVAEFVEAVQRGLPARRSCSSRTSATRTPSGCWSGGATKVCTFNDDIQGTAAVTLAGIYSALRLTGKTLREQKLLFLGAGEAGIGIGDLIVSAMVDEGATLEEARRRCWFVDSQGLVVKSRDRPGRAQAPLRPRRPGGARPPRRRSRRSAPPPSSGSRRCRAPSTSGSSRRCRRMNERPIVFALSNPTSKSECTAEEAYRLVGRARPSSRAGAPSRPATWTAGPSSPARATTPTSSRAWGSGVVACRGPAASPTGCSRRRRGRWPRWCSPPTWSWGGSTRR